MGDSVTQKLEVVIPVGPKSQSLSLALDSIRNQFNTSRVILVNDSNEELFTSASFTTEILSSKKRGNISSNRNVGLQSAKTEFVAFLDADDMYNDGFAERAIAVLQENRDAVATVCLTSAYIDSSVGFWLKMKINLYVAVKNLLLLFFFHVNSGRLPREGAFLTQISHMTFRRADLPEFDESMHFAEDWDFVYRVAAKGGLAIVPWKLTKYRFEEGSYSFHAGQRRSKSKRIDYSRFLAQMSRKNPRHPLVLLFHVYSRLFVLS